MSIRTIQGNMRASTLKTATNSKKVMKVLLVGDPMELDVKLHLKSYKTTFGQMPNYLKMKTFTLEIVFKKDTTTAFKTRNCWFKINKVYHKTDDKLFDEIKQQLNEQREDYCRDFWTCVLLFYSVISDHGKHPQNLYLQNPLYKHLKTK